MLYIIITYKFCQLKINFKNKILKIKYFNFYRIKKISEKTQAKRVYIHATVPKNTTMYNCLPKNKKIRNGQVSR